MPRPKTKTFRLNIRYDEAFRAKLEQLRAGTNLDMVDVIRLAVMGMTKVEAPPPPIPMFDQEAVSQLARMGQNLNQISRRLNEHPWESLGEAEVKALAGVIQYVTEVVLGTREREELAQRAEHYYRNSTVLPLLDRIHGRLKELVALLKTWRQGAKGDASLAPGSSGYTLLQEVQSTFSAVDKLLLKVSAALLGLDPRDEVIADLGLTNVKARERGDAGASAASP